MKLIIGFIVFVVVSLIFVAIFVTKSIQNKMRGTWRSEGIIRAFEPGNEAPELSKMIQYHKEHGVVNYDI